LSHAVIIDAVRTPIGKLGGALINETPDLLGAHVLTSLYLRVGFEKNDIDEIILGQAKQTADISNVARVASLAAEYPVEVPSFTIHRQCGSGLQAVNSAAQQIMSGLGKIIVAGGVESMSTAPFYVNNVRFGVGSGDVKLKDPNVASQPGSQPINQYGVFTMGDTAENLAIQYAISREEQDEFANESQVRAANAIEKRYFTTEISPYTITKGKQSIVFDTDEHPRPTAIKKLNALKPVFQKDGTVTAGNSSGRNDGASALLIANETYAREKGLQPKVRILTQAAVGCNPKTMGLGPVYATRKALKQVGLQLEQIDIIELNEAFASQALACIKELDLDSAKVNPNGGAIAFGHPIGATGAILMTKLIHELQRSGKKYGLVTLCIAGGLGITTIVENLQV
jgi:acetyl-CoA C-acetyltransferase